LLAPRWSLLYGANIQNSKNPERIQKWGLGLRDYYLIVGRLVPDNNADFIIHEFLKTDSIRKLVIVGDVPYLDKYAHCLRRLPDSRLVFTGYIHDEEDLAELYHHCYAYLHGHEFGGTNPALLQALGYGSAVLALDTPFNREVLKEGEYGLFFLKKSGQLEALIKKMEKEPLFLDALRSRSQERIRQNYTWEKITSQYQQLFEEMMQE